MTEKEIVKASIDKLVDYYIDKRKVGNVQINFFKGGVTTINLNETVKITPEKE